MHRPEGDTVSEMAAPRRNEGVAQRSDEEYVLEGIGVSPGIAIGPVYLYARDAYEVEKRRLA
ncbi:hypothetical protein HF633_13765, partial [Weissella cibaria]|nr:hypothetical protein [Weissella cibaria]